jgi:hypothetical protein
VYAQTPGIYFVTVPSKNSFCEQKIRTYFGKGWYCISKKPIVSIEEIEYVTDILYDSQSKINYIDVGLSAASVSILNKVYQSMPGSQLALVAEKKALGQFTIDERILARKMTIGKDLDLKQLKVIRDILKEQNLKKD